MFEVGDPAELAGTWLEPCLNSYTPEQKLCFAMISRALLDLHSPDASYRRSARKWILQAHPEYILSFNNCCEECGFEVDQLRARALSLSHQYEKAAALAAATNALSEFQRNLRSVS